jgi:hypothetical protein
MVLLPFVLRNQVFINGYRRTVVDVAESVIGYGLYVAYFGVSGQRKTETCCPNELVKTPCQLVTF